jgi:integrase
MQRIAEATCPADKSHVLLWDSERPGLAARIYPSGRKQFVLLYRAGGGRQGKLRWLTLGEVAALGLAEARTAAGVHLGAVARGEDPAERKREVRRRERAIVSAALDRYGQEIESRKLAKADQIMSTLRRGLAADLRRDLAELDRATLVERIEAVARNYGAGAGAYFRARLSTFCSWAAEKGLVTANPLAGWRRQRRSRAERLDRTGRALEDWELRAAWSAFDASDDPVFAAYLRTLLLAGQRRTETALMRWSDLEVNAGVWTIPAEVTKSGRAHRVPVAPELARILRDLPRLARNDLVFPGRRGRPISGFSQRLKAVHNASSSAGLAHWTLHDLRRTVRTGLGRLGVDPQTSELLLNHAIGDELAATYDRGDYWRQRVEAAGRWARHLLGLVEGEPERIIAMPRRATG